MLREFEDHSETEDARVLKMGPITKGEWRAILTWERSLTGDIQLRDSIVEEDTSERVWSSYVLVRALRAGVRLEDLV